MSFRRSLAAAAFAAAALSSTALAQDSFEPNDDCTAPPMLSAGTTTGLDLNPDADYFAVQVPANANIEISADRTLGGNFDVMLFEPTCGTMLASATAGPLSYFDCGGLARDLVVFVPATGGATEAYDLTFTATEIVDDAFEDNDSCAAGIPTTLSAFTTTGLVVTGCDEDYFSARLENAGVDIQIDVLFDHSAGDIDIELWDEGCTTLLDSSTSTTDNETVGFLNSTVPSVPLNVTLRVFLKNGEGFAPYAVTACFGSPTLPTVGTQSCAGVVNSTGSPGTLCGRGSDVVTDDTLLLYVVDLPAGSAGYFITSPTPDFTANPAGSQGNLCLDAPGRYSFDPLFTQGQSAVFYQPDLSNTPIAGGGFGPVTAGTRQYWQYWYRDSVNGMAVSNFSSALFVDFQ